MDHESIARRIAKLFISRSDTKAVQKPSGAYNPVEEKWTLPDLVDHLDGTRTYGHYLLGTDETVKLFALDIDLQETGFWEQPVDLSHLTEAEVAAMSHADTVVRHEGVDPRALFGDWAHPSRAFYKNQMRYMADLFTGAITSELGIPAIAAFSGSKGIHVYGMTGPMPAAEAREAARIVLERFNGVFAPVRGDTFWGCADPEPGADFSSFGIEVFPKNDGLGGGKGLGNLMRLPLGTNLKAPRNPCFFIDTRAGIAGLAPHPDPLAVLDALDCAADPRE